MEDAPHGHIRGGVACPLKLHPTADARRRGVRRFLGLATPGACARTWPTGHTSIITQTVVSITRWTRVEHLLGRIHQRSNVGE